MKFSIKLTTKFCLTLRYGAGVRGGGLEENKSNQMRMERVIPNEMDAEASGQESWGMAVRCPVIQTLYGPKPG
jgi:hypothetical protein